MEDNHQTNRDTLSAAIAARAEDLALVKHKAKFYSRLALANLAAFAVVLKGMPMHALWNTVGPLFGISLVCVSATAGYYWVVFLTDSVDARKP